jgi:Zn-dependent protease with chaperone function
MSDGIATSFISAAALVLVAFITFVLNRRMELSAAWRNKKLEYYEALVDALARMVAADDPEAAYDFARESNNIHLVAPTSVLQALHAYRLQPRTTADSFDQAESNSLLANLLKAIRLDMGLPQAEDIDGRHVQLVTSPRARHPSIAQQIRRDKSSS